MMILKQKVVEAPSSKMERAGYEAEKQMEFYLRRAFAESPDVSVFNDMRFVRNGEVAQIDHLVLHRFGFVLVESKSVTGTIEVNPKLEFVRVFGGSRKGMKSPISQVQMQKQVLQNLLNDDKERLRRKVFLGTMQGDFSDTRFHNFVAISDQGEIRRKGCDPRELMKADRVTTEIQEIIERHASVAGLGGMVRFMFAGKKKSNGKVDDIVPAFTDDEMVVIRDFLLSEHVDDSMIVLLEAATPVERPRVPAPTPPKPSPTLSNLCRHCGSSNLEIRSGQYGYYFKCRACQKNTPIDFGCTRCGKKARIRKAGPNFTRLCSDCGADEQFFANPSQ